MGHQFNPGQRLQLQICIKNVKINDMSDTASEASVIVARDLPKLLKILTEDLRVLFGNQLGAIFLPLLRANSTKQQPKGQHPEGEVDEDRSLYNVQDDCASVMNTLGLQLRRILSRGDEMTTIGGARIEPGTVVIDCTKPEKFIGFLQNLNPTDMSFNDLGLSLQKLGQEFYEQICYRYDLDSLGDIEIALIGNLPVFAEEFRRLGLLETSRKLNDCAQAVRGKYIHEYALLAKQGIFENDISMRYIENKENGWYERDWDSALKALITANENPNARAFVQITRDDLMEKARCAKQIFDQRQPRTDGYYFALRAAQTLQRIMRSLLLIDSSVSE